MARAAKTPKQNTREAEDSPKPARAGERAEAAQEGAAARAAAPDQDPATPPGARVADGGGAARAAAATPPEVAPPHALLVTGPKRGFRRAGRLFGPTPTRIPLSELTPTEVAALQAEPMLIVTVDPDPN